MLEKYFAEFNVSEQELKESIHWTLVCLYSIDSEEWPYEFLEEITPEKPLEEFLQSLRHLIPKLPTDLLIQCGYELSEVLRIIAIKLWMLLEGHELNRRLTKMLFVACCDSFLGMRYLLEAEILAKKLNKELLSDPAVIFPILLKDYFDPDKGLRVLAAKKIAQQEIDRLFEDEAGRQFIPLIREFESAVEKYMKDHYFEAVFESFGRIANEAYIKNSGIVSAKLQIDMSYSPTQVRGWAEESIKLVRSSASRRLGIKKGGKRERKGFSWTDEKNVAFFKTVKSLPKVRKQSCWQFALDELIAQEFSADTVSWLKGHPAFSALPESLFKDAIKVWRKYLGSGNWNEIKREESPRAFEFRHAAYLLGYPDKFAFATLETHFYAGKKLLERES